MASNTLTDEQRKSAEEMAEVLKAAPADKRSRLCDIMYGYKSGLQDGFRLAVTPSPAVPQ